MRRSWVVVLLFSAVACSSDDGAVSRGVGAACAGSGECTEAGQTCLSFKGGYCGLAGCTKDADCPDGSRCVTHDDQVNYCFLTCVDKSDCNVHRPVDAEANCSSTVVYVDGTKSTKACVPPSDKAK